MVRRRSSEAGMTLMETLCALAVLTIVGGAVVFGSPQHYRVIANSHRQTVALRAAQAHLEMLEQAPAVGTSEHALRDAATATLPNGQLERTVSLRPDGTAEVHVVVRWEEQEDVCGHIELTTLMAPERAR